MGTTTYLVDAGNQPVHQWESEYKAGQSAFLLDDGSILRPGSINDVAPDNRFVAAYREGHNETFQVGGFIQRISKDSEVEWAYEYYSDNNVADPGRGLDGGDSRVVEIEPPIQPDGSYTMEGGVYGPSQPVMAADLGVTATSVGTAQRIADGNTLSCDCTASKAIWLDPSGNVVSTSQIWENTTQDGDQTQVFRLVGYSKSDPGVVALELGGG